MDVPDDVGRCVDEAPEQRLVADDSGVIVDVGRGRDSIEKFGEVRRSTCRFDFIRAFLSSSLSVMTSTTSPRSNRRTMPRKRRRLASR